MVLVLWVSVVIWFWWWQDLSQLLPACPVSSRHRLTLPGFLLLVDTGLWGRTLLSLFLTHRLGLWSSVRSCFLAEHTGQVRGSTPSFGAYNTLHTIRVSNTSHLCVPSQGNGWTLGSQPLTIMMISFSPQCVPHSCSCRQGSPEENTMPVSAPHLLNVGPGTRQPALPHHSVLHCCLPWSRSHPLCPLHGVHGEEVSWWLRHNRLRHSGVLKVWCAAERRGLWNTEGRRCSGVCSAEFLSTQGAINFIDPLQRARFLFHWFPLLSVFHVIDFGFCFFPLLLSMGVWLLCFRDLEVGNLIID